MKIDKASEMANLVIDTIKKEKEKSASEYIIFETSEEPVNKFLCNFN